MASAPVAVGQVSFETVHADLLRFFPELVAQLGGDVDALLGRVGIPRAALEGAVTYRRMVELLDHAASALGCADFGMRLAQLQGGGVDTFGVIGYGMRSSGTLGDALRYVHDYNYAHSLAAKIWMRALPGQGETFVGHDILLDRLPDRRQAVEQIMLAGQIAAAEMTGGRARGRRVHFRHDPVSPPERYRRYFGCEARFGQDADGLVFSDQAFATPILAHDGAHLREITAFIERRFTRQQAPLHAQVRGIAARLIRAGRCTNDQVAFEVNLHPRTLHRRLCEEGTSFQRIKDEVRRDMLLYYLHHSGHDFARISELLGFAEQSVMTRSCHRWLGASPTVIRARGA